MASPKTALSGSSKTPQILGEDQHAAFQERLRQSISRRAYDIYQGEGRQDGSDLQHWIQAENEVLQRGLEVRESGSWLALNASIPDSTADDIDICLTPTSITIHAQKQEPIQNADAHAQGLTQREVFLTQDLNTEIEPSTASATLKDQKLTVMVKKRYPVSAAGAGTSAAATTSATPQATSTTSPSSASNSSPSSRKESTKA